MLTGFRSIPLFDLLRGPFGRLLRVAVVTGVRGSARYRQIRARDTHTVVMAGINHHITACGHVTFRATGTLVIDFMKMMFAVVVSIRQVTLQADRITGRK